MVATLPESSARSCLAAAYQSITKPCIVYFEKGIFRSWTSIGGGGILCRERATKEKQTPGPVLSLARTTRDPAPNEKQTMPESWTRQMVPLETVPHMIHSFYIMQQCARHSFVSVIAPLITFRTVIWAMMELHTRCMIDDYEWIWASEALRQTALSWHLLT